MTSRESLRRRSSTRWHSRRRLGFSLPELLAAMTISGILLMGMYKLMRGQSRAYGQQVAVTDVSESVRGASALLAWELRHASMAGDTLMSMSASQLSVRSVQGIGTVCAKASSAKYGIWKNGGDIQATSDDSALIYQQTLQKWKKLKIAAVGTPDAMGVTSCAWSGTRAPDIVIQLTVTAPSDTSGILVGSTVRAFRRVQYAEYLESGRYWLGRQIGSGSWEKVTGPLLAPASNGLTFTYHDSTGAVTAVARNVRHVGISIRSQSYKQYMGANGKVQYRGDSLFTKVMLRP